MATSESIDFNDDTNSIIKDALLLVHGVEDDESPSSEQYAHGKRVLNRMVKAWSAKGLKAWVEQDHTLRLTSGKNKYTLHAINRPLKISNVTKVVDDSETPIRLVDRSEYRNQPGKDSTGKPVFVYYDPQLEHGILYVWPTPDSSTDQLKFTYRSYIEDFDETSDNPHFPAEWLEALVYNLAVRLAPQYELNPQEAMQLGAMAQAFLTDAENSDMEDGSLFLSPEDEY